MSRKAAAEYVPEVFEIVHRIEALLRASKRLGNELCLYRICQNKWLVVTPSNINSYGVPAYGIGNSYGSYAVATTGSNGADTLKEVVTMFVITPFTGCCALCISTTATVYNPYRNLGVNKLGIALREALAGAAGYTGLVCTDIVNSIYSIRTIEGAGFKKLYQLKNKRTSNEVNLYLKELK